MSTAFAFEPVRRPGPIAPIGREHPVPVSPLVEGSPAAAPRIAAGARPKVLAATVVMTGTVCVVAAQLLLSIGTANGAYRLAALEQHADLLERRQQVQAEALQALAAPQRLAAQAAALGMVPDDSPAYLDARTGAVLGSTRATTGSAAHPSAIVR